MDNSISLYFFVGTTAELIKLFPVMRELSERKVAFRIIATGQNQLSNSELLPLAGTDHVDLTLTHGPTWPSALGLFIWSVKLLAFSRSKLKPLFKKDGCRQPVLVVHGDTVSAALGAMIARLLGCKLAHIEAGLRSSRLLRPFPEELCRRLIDALSDIAFAPGDQAAINLRNRKIEVINTKQNTLLDALRLVQSEVNSMKPSGAPEKYFIFVLHRQENLFSKDRVLGILNQVLPHCKKLPCIFILHRPTEEALKRHGLLQTVLQTPNLTALPRQPYIKFIQLLIGAEFIVTDGGSNQEECYYLGKPCLILRSESERTEGLGANAVLSNCDPAVIGHFMEHHAEFSRPRVDLAERPTAKIAERLVHFSKAGQARLNDD